MGKHAEKVGSFEDFKAPWETESGDEAEVDKGKLKRLMYNARRAEAVALDERDEAREARTAAETERDEAKEEAAKASPDEANKKIERLEKENTSLKAERDGLVKDKEIADLRAEVLGDFAAEHPKAAKYVKGETKEELEASLAEIREDFGLGESKDSDDDDDEEEQPAGRTQPRRLVNSGDPKSGTITGPEEYDFDKIADEVMGRGVFG